MSTYLLIWILAIYALLATASLAGVAVFIISKGNSYAGRFKRNLTYSDNVLNNLLQNIVTTHKKHQAETTMLIKNVTTLKDLVNNMLVMNGEQIPNEQYLINKYPENRILKEMGGNHNINVVGEQKVEPIKKVVSSSVIVPATPKPDPNYYVGDFINEGCPLCNSQLIGNKMGDKWCSNKGCQFETGINEQLPFIEKKNPDTVIFDSYEAEKNDINLLEPKINFEVEDTIQKYNNNLDNADYTPSLKEIMRQQHKQTANIKFED